MESTRVRSLRRAPRMTVKEEIKDLLRREGAMSRAAIAQHLNRRISSICGRVNELMKEGAVFISGETWDSETGYNVEKVEATS